MTNEQKLEFQEIAMRIAGYTNDRFICASIDGETMRLSYLKEEPTLARLEENKKDLALLEAGKNVVWLGMV